MWKDLTMAQKSELIGMAVKQGITDLNTVREIYDNSNPIRSNNSGSRRFDDGGDTQDTQDPKYTESGIWDFVTSFGRVRPGTKIYTKDISFKEAFRNARNSGDNIFIYNGNRYNTNIKPDEWVEQVSSTNPETLRGVAARKLQIREPDEYRSLSQREIDEKLSKHDFMKVIPFHSNIKYDDINETVVALHEAGLSKSQIAAMLGNSLSESSWRNQKQSNGSATGFYQMEPAEKIKYLKYLRDNNLKGTIKDESLYIANLFNTRSSDLNTPYTRAVEAEGENFDTLKYKTASKPEYRGYTSDTAWNDWNSNTVDGATRGFLSLYERAGKPELDRRKFLANILLEDPNISWQKRLGGYLSIKRV